VQLRQIPRWRFLLSTHPCPAGSLHHRERAIGPRLRLRILEIPPRATVVVQFAYQLVSNVATSAKELAHPTCRMSI
jgi:hypothetical protein